MDNQLQGQIVDWFFLDMDYQKNTSNKAVNQRQPALTLFEDTLEVLIIKNLEEFKHGMSQTRVNQLKSFFCMSLSIRINEYIANNIDDFQLLPTPQLVKIIEIEIMSYLNWLSTKSTYKFSASFSLTTATILQQVHQLATIMQYLLIADYHINNYRKKIKINAIHDLIENNHSESIIFSDFPNWLNSLGIRVAINYESHQLYFEVLNVLKKNC
ncbi:hypothetical protein ABTQ33_04475 [Paucilactobacillus suebicus]|uniref:Uncharacterized protein n=1 Tax=Paucilactobacillus suebicus DSM 5007 = KCTC 3549 TaxID=1423807 RepID=A0A0R1VYU7_9LACO|nr:hypothetical protein [Paucilactobacillus suebicus]KRM10578.1 hypothetical protein FD16_GL001180 [Paucilactobacillus suebicus DSM 5007 = KCTC 3549]